MIYVGMLTTATEIFNQEDRHISTALVHHASSSFTVLGPRSRSFGREVHHRICCCCWNGSIFLCTSEHPIFGFFAASDRSHFYHCPVTEPWKLVSCTIVSGTTVTKFINASYEGPDDAGVSPADSSFSARVFQPPSICRECSGGHFIGLQRHSGSYLLRGSWVISREEPNP